jgi:GGDEF domain-containing protein
MGIAEFPVDDPTGAGVVSKADKALYTAKKTGKNKIYVI